MVASCPAPSCASSASSSPTTSLRRRRVCSPCWPSLARTTWPRSSACSTSTEVGTHPMNNAELIVKTLRAAGVSYGFGIPSGNVLPLLEAMRVGRLPYVLTAHEGSAAFAADVMGRVTGAPGLCIATLGPGATNLTTGVGNAYLDRSPLLAITCNLPTSQLGRRIQMAIEDVPPSPAGRRLRTASEASMRRAAEILGVARRPMAVLGSSAMRLRNPHLLQSMIDRHRLPFASTTMAKGMISEDHPLSLGCIERARRQVQRQLLRSADLVVGLGYDVVEVEYEAWIGKVPLLAIDVDPVDADPSVTIAHEVVGDLDASLEWLAELPPVRPEWPAEMAALHRDRFHRSLRPALAGFVPHHAIDVVREVLPRDGVLAFDVGAHTHQIASQWPAHAPRTFLITNGWSSMGFGLPAAIAAKLASPERAVVALIGDGCFQMTCGEVAVARRLGLSLPIVVLD